MKSRNEYDTLCVADLRGQLPVSRALDPDLDGYINRVSNFSTHFCVPTLCLPSYQALLVPTAPPLLDITSKSVR